jgi:histidine triad (HIT) family protein
MSYDAENVFAKILRGDITANRIYEDGFAIAFADRAPVAPTHVLVIPKVGYENYEAFIAHAGDDEIVGFFRAVRQVAIQLGVSDNFRLITNNGAGAGQSVFHFHVHLLAGKKMDALLPE